MKVKTESYLDVFLNKVDNTKAIMNVDGYVAMHVYQAPLGPTCPPMMAPSELELLADICLKL